MVSETTRFAHKDLEVLAATRRRRVAEQATSLDGLRALAVRASTHEANSFDNYMLVPGTTDVWIHADVVPDVPFRAGQNATTAVLAQAASHKRLAPDLEHWEQHLDSQSHQGV